MKLVFLRNKDSLAKNYHLLYDKENSLERMEYMKKSVLKEEFRSEIEKVWNAVTDNRNYQWRSDISNVEWIDIGRSFVEKAKNGIKTEFYITNKISCKVYEMDFRNKNLKGHFCGQFERIPSGGTQLILTETIQFRSIWVAVAAGITGALKRMQKNYVTDLKRFLAET